MYLMNLPVQNDRHCGDWMDGGTMFPNGEDTEIPFWVAQPVKALN